MPASKSKSGGFVLKQRRLPGCAGVADFTINRKPCLGMIGQLRCCKVVVMATVAIRRCSGVTVGMACCTLHRGMCTGQREAGCTVIECGLQPVFRIVAQFTIRREIGSHVPFGIGVLNLVTGITGRTGRCG